MDAALKYIPFLAEEQYEVTVTLSPVFGVN